MNIFSCVLFYLFLFFSSAILNGASLATIHSDPSIVVSDLRHRLMPESPKSVTNVDRKDSLNRKALHEELDNDFTRYELSSFFISCNDEALFDVDSPFWKRFIFESSYFLSFLPENFFDQSQVDFKVDFQLCRYFRDDDGLRSFSFSFLVFNPLREETFSAFDFCQSLAAQDKLLLCDEKKIDSIVDLFINNIFSNVKMRLPFNDLFGIGEKHYFKKKDLKRDLKICIKDKLYDYHYLRSHLQEIEESYFLLDISSIQKAYFVLFEYLRQLEGKQSPFDYTEEEIEKKLLFANRHRASFAKLGGLADKVVRLRYLADEVRRLRDLTDEAQEEI